MTSLDISDGALLVVALIAPKLRELGFSRKGVSFNRRRDEGIFHEISVFEAPRWMEGFGDVFLRFGCYVPETSTYIKTDTAPSYWVTNEACAIRASLPKEMGWPFDMPASPTSLAEIQSTLQQGLEVLDQLNDRLSLFEVVEKSDIFSSAIPKPVFDTCVVGQSGDQHTASSMIRQYFDSLEKPNEHADYVKKWARLHLRVDL